MSDWFTDEELDRIARFAESPVHSRDPEMLVPGENTDEATADADPAVADGEGRDGETSRDGEAARDGKTGRDGGAARDDESAEE